VAVNESTRGLGGIYLASLVVMLSVVVIARAAGLPWRQWFGMADPRESMLGAVRRAVLNFMPYIA